MIVVIGSPQARLVGERIRAAGSSSQVAIAAAAAGSEVQLVGCVGDDPAGDAVLHDLASLGVGHVAVLRDASRPTPPARTEPSEPTGAETLDLLAAADLLAGAEDPPGDIADGLPIDAGDVELGLRYLVDFRVIVVVGAVDTTTIEVIEQAAASSEATVVAVVSDASAPSPAGTSATVLVRPADDAQAFGELVGRYAAALDAGTSPPAAFDLAARGVGWETAEA